MQLQETPTATGPDHAVRFYDRDDELLEEVTDFLDTALRADGLAVAIATAPHRAELSRRLSGFGRDQRKGSGWYGGQLVLLDAKETLDGFMASKRPDPARFDAVIGPLVNQGPAGKPLHAFGEMVAVLCEEGNYEGALELEYLWNGLLRRKSFSLFCGYPWKLFATGDKARAFQHVCDAHRRVTDPVPAGPDASIAVLRQQVRALESELEQRRRSEETLRERELDLVEFVENAVEGIHKVAPDGTILYANRAEFKLLGYEWDEYVGHNIADFYVDRNQIRRVLERLSKGEVLKDEPALLRCKDGSQRHVLVCSNARFDDGVFSYTRCFTRDASDRLARDSVVMRAPIGAVLLAAPDLRFELANDAYCEMFGCGNVIGKTFTEVFPDMRGRGAEKQLQEVMRTGVPYERDEYRVHAGGADGAGDRFVKFNLQPLPSRIAGLHDIIAVVVDVTEHVRARRDIERVALEREGLLDEVRNASRVKDEFLAMLGHELRNPLSPIVTALRLMELRGEGDTSRERVIIRRQVQHLVRLVDDLLDITRISRGNIELKPQHCELSAVVAHAVEQAGVLIEQHGHRLEMEVADDLWCRCDPVRMAQVLANLLTNAARYTPPGGRIELRAWREDTGRLAVSVRDNGAGIAPEILPKVFDLFFQGHRGIERAEGGLGIGLALVRSLVQLHGGSVEAKSEGAGRGSEFTVRIPVEPPA